MAGLDPRPDLPILRVLRKIAIDDVQKLLHQSPDILIHNLPAPIPRPLLRQTLTLPGQEASELRVAVIDELVRPHEIHGVASPFQMVLRDALRQVLQTQQVAAGTHHLRYVVIAGKALNSFRGPE